MATPKVPWSFCRACWTAHSNWFWLPQPAGVVIAVQIADQVRDDLGVRLADERDPLAPQPGLERAVVLDDPVMDDGDLARVIHVRVGIDRVRLAVRSPAGVADAQHVGVLGPVEDLFQGADPAAGLLDADAAVPEQRDARGVIAPVLEPLEALDQDRLSGLPSQISNNTTHRRLSIDDLPGTIESTVTGPDCTEKRNMPPADSC